MDAILDRLDSMRTQSLAVGVDVARQVLSNPLLSREQRESWGTQYMRTVVAQLDDIDRQIGDRVCVLVRAAA